MKTHWLAKHNNFYFQVTTIVRGFLKDKDSKPSSNEDLESELVVNGKLLDRKRASGERTSKVLTKANAKEESLSKKHKEAFDLY